MVNLQEIVDTFIKNPLLAIGFYGPIFLILINIYYLCDIYFWLCIYLLFVVINTFVNKGLKLLIKEPRPNNWNAFASFEILSGSEKYGMPSGHTQSAMFSVMFYYFMFDIDEVLYIMLLITAITSYQRYHNNNHSLLQILIGLCIGGIFAWAVYYFAKKYKHKILS